MIRWLSKYVNYASSASFLKMGKIMLVRSNYAQNYASTIYESVGEGGGGHNFGAFDGLIIGILRYFNQSSCSVDDTGEWKCT